MLYIMLTADSLFFIIKNLFIKKILLFIQIRLKNTDPLHRKLNRLPGQARKESKVFCGRKELNRMCHVSDRYPMHACTHRRMIHVHTHVTTRIVLPTRPVYRHGMARLSERAGCYTSGNQDLFACGRPNQLAANSETPLPPIRLQADLMLPPPPVSSVYTHVRIHSLYVRACVRSQERTSERECVGFPQFSPPPPTIRARRPCSLPLSRRALIPIRKQHRHQVVVARSNEKPLANDADSPDADYVASVETATITNKYHVTCTKK